ncbi:PAS domain S-box protein, partial [bacterium]|nr:PAS domain S-box protein [bacterium]
MLMCFKSIASVSHPELPDATLIRYHRHAGELVLSDPIGQRCQLLIVLETAGGELAGKNPYGLIVPEAVRPYLDGLMASLDSDQTVRGINENLTKDGRTITCEWFNTPLRNDRGELMALMAMVSDITEEQRTLAALRESEARYRSLFTGNHAIMLLIDPDDGSIVDANPAACAYYGIPANRLTRMGISQI